MRQVKRALTVMMVLALLQMDGLEAWGESASQSVAASGSGVSRKNPAVAFGLSVLIAGGGQFYNGQGGKGFLMLFAEIVGLGVTLANADLDIMQQGGGGSNTVAAVGAGIAATSWIWSMIDAPIVASRTASRSVASSSECPLQLTRLGQDMSFAPALNLRFRF